MYMALFMQWMSIAEKPEGMVQWIGLPENLQETPIFNGF